MEMNVNSILKTVNLTKQLDVLKKKVLDKKKDSKNDDLQPYRQFCCHEDSTTALMACEAIVDLVKFTNLSITQAMSFFIASLQSTKNITGLTKGITDLMLMSIQSKSSAKSVSWDLLHHPLILLLKQDAENWPIVELQLKLIFDVSQTCAFDLLKHVFVYGLWSPRRIVNTCCKHELWKYLVTNATLDMEFFLVTLLWLRIDDSQAILDIAYFVTSLVEHESLIEENNLGNVLSLVLAAVSCNLAVHGYQPDFCLKLTKKFLKKYPVSTDLVLIHFSRIFHSCPIRYLHNFVHCCVDVIQTNGFSDVTVVWIVIAALLPWLIQPLSILSNVHVASDSLFEVAEKTYGKYCREGYLQTLSEDKKFQRYIASNRDSYWAFTLMKKLKSSSPASVVQSLDRFPLDMEDIKGNYTMSLFLNGILLAVDDALIQKSVLRVLMKTNANVQLPVILFLLSKTPFPDLQLILTYSLPLTTVDKDNISPVLTTLNALTSSKKPVLDQVSVQLYLELWKIEKRCYPYLSEQIQKHKVISPDMDWEKDVIVAHAIREICTLEPVRYGKEWVPLLSDIMNRCTETHDCLPLVKALEAILKLCEAGVVNVLTVYKELSYQRIFEDRRPKVIEKLCLLVEMIFAQMRETTVDQHWPTIITALETMWHLIDVFRSKQIVVVALRALSKFDVALMPLSVIPNELRKDIKQSSSVDTSLAHVPGYVWINYLQKVREDIKLEVCGMISLWLQTEVSHLGRSFQRSIRGEPQDVSFLPDKSIFKAIVKFLKKLVIRNVPCSVNETRSVILCLVILNEESVTQLPLFDWTFLDYFLTKYAIIKKLTRLILQFYAKQSGSSASARKGIENYLKAIDLSASNPEEIKLMLTVLPKACCTVSPPIFANIVTPAVTVISEELRNDKDDLFIVACNYFMKTLKQTDLDEHNRDCVCENILRLWDEVSMKSSKNERLVLMVKIIMQMPRTFIEHLVAIEENNESDVERFRRFMKFVYLVCMESSKSENPFSWINSSINLAFKQSTIERESFFLFTKEILRKYRFHLGKWPWLLQFMDHIYKGMDEQTLSVANVCFKCDVLIFMIVVVSSFFPFIKRSMHVSEYKEYFPQALNDIIFKDVSSKVVEWLYFMSRSEKIPKEYCDVFKNAIIALKYDNYLQNVSVWSKIVNDF